MNIAIKSEADSRMLVYPLLKVLIDYGTVGLFTSNPFSSRLIEDELEGGFRNIVVVPVLDGDLRKAMEEDECVEGKYDFTIFDNVGALDYDVLLCVMTNHITETYMEDLKLVVDEPGVHIVRFGSPAKKPKAAKAKKAKVSKKKGSKSEEPEDQEEVTGTRDIMDVVSEEESINDIPDDEYNKWTVQKTEADILVDKLTMKDSKWCKFLTFEQIEELEARHTFFVPDDNVLKEIYRIFKSRFGIDERMFLRGAKMKDESKTIVQGIDIT